MHSNPLESTSGELAIGRTRVAEVLNECKVPKTLKDRIMGACPDLENEVANVIGCYALGKAVAAVGMPFQMPTLVVDLLDDDDDDDTNQNQPEGLDVQIVPASPDSPGGDLDFNDHDSKPAHDHEVHEPKSQHIFEGLVSRMSWAFGQQESQQGQNHDRDTSGPSSSGLGLHQPEQEQTQSQSAAAEGCASSLVVVVAHAHSHALGDVGPNADGDYSRAQLMKLERHEITKHCLKLQKFNRQKKNSVQALQNKVKRLNRRVLKLEKQKNQLVQSNQLSKIDEQFRLRKRGEGIDGRGGRLSLNSVFSVGLRRCCTSVAAADFSVLSMMDVSGQTVLRRELRTAAAICLAMRQYVSCAVDDVMFRHRHGQWSLVSIGVRADATNSSVWRRSKLHVLEATVSYINDFQSLQSGDFASSICSRRCVCLDFVGTVSIFCSRLSFSHTDIQTLTSDIVTDTQI